jgi:hypothetical protein
VNVVVIESPHTSYSSFTAWLRCQKKWELTRVEEVDRVPGWNLVGGKAVHLLTEQWEQEYSGAVT